jgi:hypothetical protein
LKFKEKEMPTKPKRKKPFAANLASTKHMEAEGWTVAAVEQVIPHTFIKRDFMGFADLIAASPTRGIMAIQATGGASTSNAAARVAKIKAEARAGIWLASGGRIQVHNWKGKGSKRELCVQEITVEVWERPSSCAATIERKQTMRKKIILLTGALAVACSALLAGEVTNELKTVLVKMMCDTPKCAGEMKPTGSVLTSMPPQYPHQCTICKSNRTYHVCYPEIRYESK